MNTTTTRRTAATLATATAAAAALTILSAIAPPTASAQCLDTCPGTVTTSLVEVDNGWTQDIGQYVAHLKTACAQYYIDHPGELLLPGGH